MKKLKSLRRSLALLASCLSLVTPALAADNGGLPAASDSVATEKASDLPRVGKRKRTRKASLISDQTEQSAEHRLLHLTFGEDRIIDIGFDPQSTDDAIQVGNPLLVGVTRVRIGDQVKQLMFKPLGKNGETKVSVRDANGNLRMIFNVIVTSTSLSRMASEIHTLLRDVEGIEIRIIGAKIVLEGEILVPADYSRVVTVLNDKTYAEYVMNFTTPSPLGLQYIAKKIQTDVNTFAPDVKARVVSGTIWLEGSVNSGGDAKHVMKVADLYLPDVKFDTPVQLGSQSAVNAAVSTHPITGRSLIQNFILINPPEPKKAEKMIRVTMHFVELDKDYEKVFGFKWAPGFSAPDSLQIGPNAGGQTTSSGVSFSATLSSLFPKLQSAQSAGYARILKTGTVIVRSGQPAVLMETTNVPYQVLGANQSVGSSFQQVGLNANVVPQILGQSEDISMDLRLKQTDLVGRSPAGTAPITADHYIETKLYVKNRESAAIGGVSSADVGTDFNKDDPNPGQITSGTSGNTSSGYLFNLMRSKNYHKKKSQFVIFVTPEIVESASDGTEDLKRNFRVKVK